MYTSEHAIEIIDRVGEFCDKGCARKVAKLTLLAQYHSTHLCEAAQKLSGRFNYIPAPDAVEVIVNAVYDAREYVYVPYGCVSEFDTINAEHGWRLAL
jgi:hypothetical protein